MLNHIISRAIDVYLWKEFVAFSPWHKFRGSVLGGSTPIGFCGLRDYPTQTLSHANLSLDWAF